MASSLFLQSIHPRLPEPFFLFLVQDMERGLWVQLFQDFPHVREAVFRGLPSGDGKIERELDRAPAAERLAEILKTDPAFFQAAADAWADANLEILAFLDMLDRRFIRENLWDLKDLLGPERLVISLFFLEEALEDLADLTAKEDFWRRRLDQRLVEFFVPVQSILRKAQKEVPESSVIFSSLGFTGTGGETSRGTVSGKGPTGKGAGHREAEKRRRLEERIEKLRQEKAALTSEKERLLSENADLKRKLREWEASFQSALEDRINEERRRWYARYETRGEIDWQGVEKASRRLDQLLIWADRTFSLQKEADERYGLIGDVRRKLLKVDLHLNEIERIFSDSLVVHPEVRRLREALLAERDRLLALPGVEKALKGLPADLRREELVRRLRLLDPAPPNLRILQRLERALRDLEAAGMLPDPETLLGEVEHKRRQILEALYGRFLKGAPPKDSRGDWKNLEDFVAGGESLRYTLYVDGYNILVRLLDSDGNRGADLADLRNDFIEAVQTKQDHFRKIVLVFDGQEDFRDRRGKVEIVYTDKSRGNTADLYIVQAIGKNKDRKALLVTEDREIIDAAGARVYGLIRPLDFYSYVHDLPRLL
ncbi:YacP-like NYN domain-containing protein [Desulfacinum infernum DSM 9756]|uniref:YacP-like NYN domain-containing protein n=1 Tax=Desulfacinum infernum DSM 9756 TaxID=1121391 RepID=A0A1M4US80_9BACT|nr:NYN domain-containing protein [Desulfacinum infernum]SHE59601.1 YacP-like NYN domain-containing protein [Desulfacinum infernum DSM 9756]